MIVASQQQPALSEVVEYLELTYLGKESDLNLSSDRTKR